MDLSHEGFITRVRVGVVTRKTIALRKVGLPQEGFITRGREGAYNQEDNC